jgi:ADP-heptose:LPS heptosyltransferase
MSIEETVEKNIKKVSFRKTRDKQAVPEAPGPVKGLNGEGQTEVKRPSDRSRNGRRACKRPLEEPPVAKEEKLPNLHERVVASAKQAVADMASSAAAGEQNQSGEVALKPRKLILKNWLSPGDILMLTAAVRDLHLTFPNEYITDIRTPSPGLWTNNPYLTPLSEEEEDVELIECKYPLIHRSNQLPFHFIHAFRLFLSEHLGREIQPHAFKGDIHLSKQEKGWMSQVEETEGRGTRFWIIVAGGKNDFTAKWWDPARAQEVVDYFKGRILFVQCGSIGSNHNHKELNGVLNLVGKTDMRQMVRLMYHADGVICPVTMFMHLAAAVETKPGRPKNRPCVVVAGGREPSQWEAYPHHTYLHTLGMLPCCDHGGCWKSRITPLGDGDEKDRSLCVRPVTTPTGVTLPQCLDMIQAADVIQAVEKYLQYDAPYQTTS